jgi:hypothetical protein
MAQRDETSLIILNRCNIGIFTLDSWIKKRRFPRQRSKEIIEEVLREKGHLQNDCQIDWDV